MQQFHVNRDGIFDNLTILKILSHYNRVIGPSSSTDNAICRYNGTTGKLLQNSLVKIGDQGVMTIPASGHIKTNSVQTISNSNLDLLPDGSGKVSITKSAGIGALLNVTNLSQNRTVIFPDADLDFAFIGTSGTFTFTGAASLSCQYTLFKQRNMITLYLTGNTTSLTSAQPFYATAAIPSGFRPRANSTSTCIVHNEGVPVLGKIQFTTAGSITVYSTIAGNVFTTGTVGIGFGITQVFTWVI